MVDNTDVTNFHDHMKRGDSAVPSLPKLIQPEWSEKSHTTDIKQKPLFIEMIKPLPLVGGRGWTLKRVFAQTVCYKKYHK
jgi:hypothetical protein